MENYVECTLYEKIYILCNINIHIIKIICDTRNNFHVVWEYIRYPKYYSDLYNMRHIYRTIFYRGSTFSIIFSKIWICIKIRHFNHKIFYILYFIIYIIIFCNNTLSYRLNLDFYIFCSFMIYEKDEEW